MKDRLPQVGVLLNADAGHLLVDDVSASGPAQRAGLRAGDRIASFDGHPVAGRLDWMTVEANLEIGRTIPLSLERDGAVLQSAITPALASWQSWRSEHG